MRKIEEIGADRRGDMRIGKDREREQGKRAGKERRAEKRR